MAVFQGGGTDKPQVVLGSVLDYFTSALLAYGVAAALFTASAAATGSISSLSLLRSALTIQAGRFVWADSEGRDAARDSGAGGLTGIHPTKQGVLYISVHSNHFFAALCELVGRPELARDPRCATMRSRAAHAAEAACRNCAPRSPRAPRSNGRRSSASACPAPRCGRSRTCSTIRRLLAEDLVADARSSGRRPLPHDDQADQIRRHAGAAAVRRADLRPAQRRDPRRITARCPCFEKRPLTS